MLTLYLSPGFSSMPPHIALHEIGADFESRWISFAKLEQYAPEYRALNPEGKVPTLLVDGRALTELAAILYYLAKRFPAADLFPADDLEAHAHVISWMSFIVSTIHPARRIGGVRAEREAGERYFFEGQWSVGKKSSKSPRSGWVDGTGPLAIIRSPTYRPFGAVLVTARGRHLPYCRLLVPPGPDASRYRLTVPCGVSTAPRDLVYDTRRRRSSFLRLSAA